MNNLFKAHVTNPIVNFFGKRKAARKFSASPVLIGGCGRSGTTLLLSILSAHPSIFALPKETNVFSIWKKGENPYRNGRDYFYPERIDRLYRYVLSKSIPGSVTRWCEKSPPNVRYLDKIFTYFNDEVRFIHIIRDGRDVMTSRHPEKPDDFWVSPERWVNDVRMGLAYADHPCVLTIRYEDLIQDHEKTLRTICEFLGEAYTEAFKDWFENASVRRNQAWYKPLQKLHSGSVQKWTKPEFKARIEEVLAYPGVRELMEELGYLPGGE